MTTILGTLVIGWVLLKVARLLVAAINGADDASLHG